MKPSRTVLLAASLMQLPGCSPSVDRDAALEALKAADRAFNQATAEQGVEGWVANFAENGVMFRAGEVVRGRDAVRDLMTPAFAAPGYAVTWEPEFGEVSATADLGYTVGHYESQVVGPAGDTLTSGGRYVTIWRKDPDGTWRVLLDIGSPREERP